MGADLHDTIGLLRKMGFVIGLDYDDTLVFESPQEVSLFEVEQFIRQHSTELARRLRLQSEYRMQRCIGGPLDGKQHEWSHCTPLYGDGNRVLSYGRAAHKLGPRRWAAYAIAMDGRAFYAGEYTSKKKAAQGASEFRTPV